VVDDQDLGVVHPPPSPVIEALLERRTVAAHAVALVAGQFVPDGPRRLVVEIGKRPVGGFLGPLLKPAELVELLVVGEEAASPLHGHFLPTHAQVVTASLDQDGRELERNHAVEERQILADQLLLQADRVRGDDHAAMPVGLLVVFVERSVLGLGRRLLAGGGEDGRHEISKALSHAGARFDDQVMPRPQRIVDRPRHFELLVTLFVAGEPRGDAAFGA
jgi:hypothetical protein